MAPRSLTTAARSLLVVAALCLGAWLFSRTPPAWPGGVRVGRSSPRLVLPVRERDLGPVRQGGVLRTSFRVANAGTRRLILREHAGSCCGGPADVRQIILAPGDATNLAVEVNTAEWCGRMEHTVRYTTNDPNLPHFALTVTASVESPLSP